MATKFKIRIEIERVDNVGEFDEEYSECDCPVSIGMYNTIEEAIAVQEEIEKHYYLNNLEIE